jgi:uncharacterized protein YndB with AHSA1/START domain
MMKTQTRRKAAIRKETYLRRTVRRVWKALTDRSDLSRWLLPVNEDIIPVVGHRFTFRAPTGERIQCEVIEAVPERRLAYTWQVAPTTQHDDKAAPTVVTWTLAPTESGTLLTVEHEGIGSFSGLLDLRACLHTDYIPGRRYRCLQGAPRPGVRYQKKGKLLCL